MSISVNYVTTGNGITFNTDANGNPIGLATPSGGTISPYPNLALKACCLGDSMTALNYAAAGAIISYSDRGYFNWANAYLGQMFEIENVAAGGGFGGVSGNKTADMFARIQSDVIAYSPKYCFVLGGYNDIVNSVATSTIIANLTAIYSMLRGSGISVIALAILPSVTFTTTAMRESLATVNLFIRQYSLRNSGMIFVDTYSPLLDPTSATGAPVANMLNADTIHPNTLGAKTMGAAIWSALKNLFPLVGFPQGLTDTVSATNPNGNIIPNPTMYGTQAANGGASGNSAVNWSNLIAGTGAAMVCSKVARTDLPNYEWLQAVCTSVVGNVTQYYIYKGVAKPASVPIGSSIYFEVEVNIAALSGATIDYLNANCVIDGASPTTAEALGNNSGLISGTGNFILRTPNLVVSAGTANITIQIVLELSAAAGSCTIQGGRSECRVVN